jgi:hypothetical protein
MGTRWNETVFKCLSSSSYYLKVISITWVWPNVTNFRSKYFSKIFRSLVIVIKVCYTAHIFTI